MRLTVLALGSRGDVQPLVALGRGLREEGVHVTVAADASFESLVGEHGLEFARVGGSLLEAMQGAAGERALAAGANPIVMARAIRQTVAPLLPELIDSLLAATATADGLLLGGPAWYPGILLAEIRQIPIAVAMLQPAIATRAFPSPMLPLPRNMDCALRNRANFAIGEQLQWQVLRPLLNGVRKQEFGLPPWPALGPPDTLRRGALHLAGYSRHVLPRPDDWPENCHVTGYWFAKAQPWQPPSELLRFLEAGPPPICVGFGSMVHPHSAAFTRTIVQALREAGLRAVFLTGWGAIDPGEVPGDMLALSDAPHEWILPRCAAIVTHCGAGSVAAALRAGTPVIPVPFFGDQPFWAWRVEELGVAPESIPRDDLVASRLARALRRATTDLRFAVRARQLASQIGEEDGVGVAVQLLMKKFITDRLHQ